MTRSKSQKYIYLCRYNKSKPYRVIISKDAAEYAAKTFKPLYMKHIFGID